MASLIWESAGFITTTSNLKFRIKMSDGSDMSTTNEGMNLKDIIDTQNYNNIGLSQDGVFKYSLGLGHIDYDYDNMWTVIEEYYSNISHLPNWFASLGGGAGLASIMLPFSSGFYPDVDGAGQVVVVNVSWESETLVNYSAIVTLMVQNEQKIWGDEIEVRRNGFHESVEALLPFGGAQFTSFYEDEWNNEVSVPKEWVDGYNILVGFVLEISGTNGSNLVYSADRAIVDSAISDGRIDFNFNTVSYAPVHFTANAYDFSVNILNLNKPNFVNEGDSAPISLQLKSQDYNGGLEIYLLDNESVAEVNEAIAEDILGWYGDIGEDVVAQYGTLDIDGEKIISDNIVEGETKLYNITYTANNVDSGQTDNMSIFIKYGTDSLINLSAYGEDEHDATVQWSLLSVSDHFSYSDNIDIPILDIYEEWVEEYNPSENLITQPSDIMHHIISEELGLDKNNIDLTSKQQSWEQHVDFKMAFSVNKEIESKTLIQEISQSCKSIPTLVNDMLKFITIKDTYNGNESMSTINADDVLNYSFSRTSLDKVRTKVEVHYEKDYGLDSYLSSSISFVNINSYFLNGDYGSLDDLENSNYYGFKYNESDNEIDHIDSFLDFECPYIRDSLSAFALSNHLLLWNLNQHNIVDLKLPLKYYSLEVGDLIDFDKMLLGKKVYGEKYVLENEGDMPFRCGQAILPLFMITETKKGLNDVKIKAIQLHHMNNNNPVWKDYEYSTPALMLQESVGQYLAGSGDVNGDGNVNILDVVTLINAIVEDNIQDWDADRISAADINGDGNVNILDVVLLVNQIIA